MTDGADQNFLDIIRRGASRDPSRDPKPKNQQAAPNPTPDPNTNYLTSIRQGASREPMRPPGDRAPSNPVSTGFPNSWRPDSSRGVLPTDPFRNFGSKTFLDSAQNSRSITQQQSKPEPLQPRQTGTRPSPDPTANFAAATSNPPAARDPFKRSAGPDRFGQSVPAPQVAPLSRGVSNPRATQDRDSYSRESSKHLTADPALPRLETHRSGQQQNWGRSSSNNFDPRNPEEPAALSRSKAASPNSTLQNSFVRNSLHFEERRNLTGNRNLIQEKFREGSRREFRLQLQELNEKKRNWVLIFFLILAFLVLWFGMAYFKVFSVRQLPFCDSYSFDFPNGCRPCPDMVTCKDGKITGCVIPGHKLIDEHCMRDDASVQQVYQEMVNYLSSLRGQAECEDQQPNFKKTRTEIQDYLSAKFKNRPNLYDSISNAIYELPLDANSTSPIGIDEGGLSPEVYYAKTPSYSLVCSVRLTVKANKFVFMTGLLLLALAFLKIEGIKREIERRKRGEQYYQYIESLLQNAHNHQMFEEEIKKHLRLHFSKSKSEIDDVFNYVMSAAYKSEKIDYTKKTENGIEQRVWWMDV